MAFPLLALAIGGLLGAGKHFLNDQPREESARKLAAETARYSPWTGLKSENVPIPKADLMGSAIQGGLTGASVHQGLGQLGDNPLPTGPQAGSPLMGWNQLASPNEFFGLSKDVLPSAWKLLGGRYGY